MGIPPCLGMLGFLPFMECSEQAFRVLVRLPQPNGNAACIGEYGTHQLDLLAFLLLVALVDADCINPDSFRLLFVTQAPQNNVRAACDGDGVFTNKQCLHAL